MKEPNVWIIGTNSRLAVPASISAIAPDGSCNIRWLEQRDGKYVVALGTTNFNHVKYSSFTGRYNIDFVNITRKGE